MTRAVHYSVSAASIAVVFLHAEHRPEYGYGDSERAPGRLSYRALRRASSRPATYANIWPIGKRLYKLYDARLPHAAADQLDRRIRWDHDPVLHPAHRPRLPFNHSLVWLYVLPPGVLTWLTTRPVIGSKRL